MITYHIPVGVDASSLQSRPMLSTCEGGKIVLDPILHSLWQQANGKSLDEIAVQFRAQQASPEAVRATLACLAEAGLLIRDDAKPEPRVYPSANGDLVSVVIVNYNSWEWLRECLPSLLHQTYSLLEIVVVDNASSDDSIDWLTAEYPSLKLVRLATSQSLARAINQGVTVAEGKYFLLLNPDVRLELDAVAQMVAIAREDRSCAAVAAKLKFWWAPAFLNGLGNRVGAFSWGTDNALGHLDLGQFDAWRELPSACFAATLIPRAAWQVVGPVDERFPMYYEDSEWCYRARLVGFKIRAAPQAVIYHAFGGRVPSGEEVGLTARKLRHVAYGRFRFTLKIVGSPLLRRFLRNYALEDWANFSRVLVQRDVRMVLAYLGAWLDCWRGLPTLLRERQTLQARRVCSDDELFGLQKDMPPPFVWHGLPELTWDLVRSEYLPLIRSGRTRPMPEFVDSKPRPHLLLVSHDVVGTKMAGPGMRYLEMARALSADLDVTLALPSDTTLQVPGISLVRYWEDRPDSLRVLIENSDVALVSGYMVEKFSFMQSTRTRLVVDLYDPFVLENLHYYANEPLSAQATLNNQAVDITNQLARLGDFFICGSERQRDFWLGVLTANHRINPYTFAHDPSLRSLIDVVGIGFPDREPRPKPTLRGVHQAFPNDVRIVLWGGGIWDWLDPLTLIRAWHQVIAQHPEARLVFLGTRHPNPLVPPHKMAEQAQALASEIGEKDRTIFFYEWLPYTEREAFLCEADIGVTLHPLHVETRYSIRTRILDYFWARLPVLVSDGDVTSDWVRQYGVGRVVPPLDFNAAAEALCEMLAKPKQSWVSAFEPLPKIFNWPRVVDPLKQYCFQNTYAADRTERLTPIPEPTSGDAWHKRYTRARYIWTTEGPRVLIHRVWRYIQWRLASL